MGLEQGVNRLGSAAIPDPDPEGTKEWIDALQSAADAWGPGRAIYLIKRLEEHGQQLGLLTRVPPYSAYRNTIPVERQPAYPGDLALEQRITSILRWNALAMVMRANAAYSDLGGHIASYASVAEIFELGFNHFFHGGDAGDGGDLVFFQPHSAPGVYARAFLEGRLTEAQLANYRQEVGGQGLSSYPHPWLMPTFWQFPTGSMGLGPMNAIYQARFLRYLRDRGLAKTDARHVWGIFGDGEMDEPESLGALSLASRERLDNLTFVINCNLQRLDGPVRGNGQIIQELESLFAGAGWNVIKVLWSSDWDTLFALDKHDALLRNFAATVDGKYQTLGAKDGQYNLDHFFGLDPELKALAAHLSAAEVDGLRRGGHDFRKLYAAFAAAREYREGPTVILAKTKKGFGMGPAGESRNIAHQAKKLDIDALTSFRDRFALPLSDDDVAVLKFIKLPENSCEALYLRSCREALGGPLPARRNRASAVKIPSLRSYADFALEAGGREMSTTVAAVRLMSNILRNETIAPRVVPIVADEARTFGMASLFHRVGIYSPVGQLYEPEDKGSLLTYREAKDGQLLEEGITEAGAISSWTAAATAYSVSGIAMLPFYIFYSMFGFQRVGDLIWAAADQRVRGFLLGATAGRTTLGGEGLQHQDGSSHLAAATIPNCRAYDPAFACELAVIMDHGMREILERDQDCFYYITVMNESYPQPSLAPDAVDGILKGLHRLRSAGGEHPAVRLIGSGATVPEVIEAAKLLKSDWFVESEVWSATSFAELAREARSVERWNRLHPEDEPRVSHVARCIPGGAPVIAVSDYVRAYPGLIATYLDARCTILGTDGFGRSDTRSRLRQFFEINRFHIVLAALFALATERLIDRRTPSEAIQQYGLSREDPDPWTC
jgi:pyruvate dehydrogenase E1 component